MTRFNSIPRLRLIALLILAIFSLSAVAVASSSLVEPASAAKKKAKKKKCKKGYKKVKGKCKKAKKKSTAAPKVTDVRVQLATSNKGQLKVVGQVRTDIASNATIAGSIVVTVGGVPQTFPEQFGGSRSTVSPFSKLVQTSFPDTDGGTVTVTVGGVTSAPATIR